MSISLSFWGVLVGLWGCLVQANKIIMSSSTQPIQDLLLRQIAHEAGLVSRQQRLSLKRQFDKKYTLHVNMLQYHNLREDRFIQSQKKVLEKHHLSVQRTKEYIALRQEKAQTNKSHSLIERSKRVENDLTKWERIVERNKMDYENRLRESETLIKNWNEKLSETSSRKSLKLNELSKNLREKTSEKQHRVQSTRQVIEQSRIKNPERNQSHSNLARLPATPSSQRSRVSTQSMFDRKKKLQQFALEKSLMQTVDKEERINQARYIRQYMQERKRKQQQEKEETIKKMREEHLNHMRNGIEERNQVLDQKYKNSTVKNRPKKSSLPQIHGTATNKLLSLGEESKKKEDSKERKEAEKKRDRSGRSLDRALEPSYDRLVMDKIRDVNLLIRKKKL